MNDAEAQALGEWLLRDGAPDDLLYIGIGTGVAGARVVAGELVHVEFSHLTSFGDAVCGGCGRTGCLDAQIGGHALPQPLTDDDRARVVRLLAAATRTVGLAEGATVAFGGGVARSYPTMVDQLQAALPDLAIEPTRAPTSAKSAAYVAVIDALTAAGVGTK